MKKIFLLFLLSVIIFVTSGCNSISVENAEREQTDELVVAFVGEPEVGFDPTLGWGQYGTSIFQSTLMTTDLEQNYIYDLATEYSISDDRLRWTFKLRDDVKFSDGEYLNAEDVAFTYMTAKEAQSEVDLTFLKNVNVIDNNIVEFELNSPRSTFIHTTTCIGIVPKDSYDKNLYPENPIGTGAYKLLQWDKGQQCILEANENYYGQEPYFKRITVLFMDENQAILAAQSGQVDIAATAPQLANTNIYGMNLISCNNTSSLGITLPYVSSGSKTFDGEDMGNDVTSDINIRKAINVAIDREQIANDALYGYGTALQSETNNTPWENKEAYVKTGDKEEAKRILDNSGWIDTDDDGIREKEGLKASFDLLYPAGDSNRQSVSLAVAQQLLEIGIEVNVQGKSWNDIDPLQHSIPVMYACSGNTPQTLYYNYHSNVLALDYHNPNCFSNKIVDRHIIDALESSTQEEANKHWKLVQWDGNTGVGSKGEVSRVWVTGTKQLYFVRDDLDLGNMKPQIGYHHDWPLLSNVIEWHWK